MRDNSEVLSFKSWLFGELVSDGFLDEDEEMPETIDELTSITDVEAADVENYREQYREYCINRSVDPVWDYSEY